MNAAHYKKNGISMKPTSQIIMKKCLRSNFEEEKNCGGTIANYLKTLTLQIQWSPHDWCSCMQAESQWAAWPGPCTSAPSLWCRW